MVLSIQLALRHGILPSDKNKWYCATNVNQHHLLHCHRCRDMQMITKSQPIQVIRVIRSDKEQVNNWVLDHGTMEFVRGTLTLGIVLLYYIYTTTGWKSKTLIGSQQSVQWQARFGKRFMRVILWLRNVIISKCYVFCAVGINQAGLSLCAYIGIHANICPNISNSVFNGNLQLK